MVDNIFETLGPVKTQVKVNDWHIPRAKITVVADGFQSILERDLFYPLGIRITQKPCPEVEIKIIDPPCAIKQP